MDGNGIFVTCSLTVRTSWSCKAYAVGLQSKINPSGYGVPSEDIWDLSSNAIVFALGHFFIWRKHIWFCLGNHHWRSLIPIQCTAKLSSYSILLLATCPSQDVSRYRHFMQQAYTYLYWPQLHQHLWHLMLMSKEAPHSVETDQSCRRWR